MAAKKHFGLRSGPLWVTGFSLSIAEKKLARAAGGELPKDYEVWRIHPATQLNLFGDLVFPKGHPPTRYKADQLPRRPRKRELFEAMGRYVAADQGKENL